MHFRNPYIADKWDFLHMVFYHQFITEYCNNKADIFVNILI